MISLTLPELSRLHTLAVVAVRASGHPGATELQRATEPREVRRLARRLDLEICAARAVAHAAGYDHGCAVDALTADALTALWALEAECVVEMDRDEGLAIQRRAG